MKKIFSVFLLVLNAVIVCAQTDMDAAIEGLVILEQYQTIIDEYATKNPDEYSAKSLYSIGFSYYMLEEDEACLKYMDFSIGKDSMNPAPYFIKGSTYSYMSKFEEAIPCFQKAIELESDENKLAPSCQGLGYVYYQLRQDELALEMYRKVIEYDSSVAIPYRMIAQIYSRLGQEDKALETYYKAKENISNESDGYTAVLFNIGVTEQLLGNFNKAESVYKELLEIDQKDYHAYSKLIQVYYHNKEYDKAQPLKAVLYKAHKDGLIVDENLSDMFCVDQFETNGRQIMVFERYEEGASVRIYNKILFYVLDKEGNVSFRIQTEYSPAAVALGEGKYMLCANKDGMHLNYGIIFDDKTNYEQIKKSVISILEKEK